MKKIFNTFLLLFLIFFVSTLTILSTIGINTNKFNNFISQKISEEKNFSLNLKSIKFKIDIKNVSLFLDIISPSIEYKEVIIPVKNIKVYIDFLSILKTEPNIKKVNLLINELEINEIKKISKVFKPSNLKSFINYKIIDGKLNSEIDLYLNKENKLDNFIARGSVEKFKAEILENVFIEKTKFSFFADKSDVLVKNFSGRLDDSEIFEGDIRLKLTPELSIETNFNLTLNYNSDSSILVNNIKNFKSLQDIDFLEAKLSNSITLNFDKTLKLKRHKYEASGQIVRGTINLKNLFKNNSLEKKFKKLSLIDSDIKISLNNFKNSSNISGKYKINDSKTLPFNFENKFDRKGANFKINANYNQSINLDFINYFKSDGIDAKILLDFEKQKKYFKINELKLSEGKNFIFLKGLKVDNSELTSLEALKVNTSINGKKNNDFTLKFGKKISIVGKKFDATNIPKLLNQQSKENKTFSNINKSIEINIENIIAPLSEKISNFKLLGNIQEGKFVKISSKGDFGNNKYLDISMKNNKKTKKKYLEIYSDITKPLLTEYEFFKGLTGGKILYTSVIDGDNSNSKLIIEDFKVINAPGIVKLLSLADLGGLADLAEGEGLSFDILEINMEKIKETLNLTEILALGPSMSVLMEGYQNPKVTSLRGTLIPAKTLNKMISKIPVIGDIVIPKEVGEGLFGISFKMKGPPGKIKTTINPIRTITPRFIQKIIDKNRTK